MSAAAGAPQPPDLLQDEPFGNPPSDRSDVSSGDSPPVLDNWVRDEKTKTCKCEPCGNRVRFWSWKCNECGRHICSECSDKDCEKSDWEKAVAYDHLHEGCWHQYRGNMNKRFYKWKPPPPKRTDEEQRALESKGLATSRKRSRTQSKRKASIPQEEDDAGSLLSGDTAPEDPEGEYQDQQPENVSVRSQSKITATKRKVYVEEDTETEIADDRQRNYPLRLKTDAVSTLFKHKALSANTSSAEIVALSTPHPVSESSIQVPHLEGASTLIVGAGIIGLFIARELALATQRANIEHHITVVEVRESYCALASGNCNGFLTTSNMSEQWARIADMAKKSWQEIISSAENRRSLRFSANTLFELSETGAVNQDRTPSWLQGKSELSLLEDFDALGRISPGALATSLYLQCQKLGVHFRFNSHLVGTEVDEDSLLEDVYIQSADKLGPEAIKGNNQNLILAAGPFTTGIFNSLFNAHRVELKNHVQSTHWFHTTMNDIAEKDDIGLRLPQAAESEALLENEITVLPLLEESALAVSATTKGSANKELNRNAALTPREGKTSALRAVAAKYMNDNRLDVGDKKQTLKKGRSELSVANDGNPIIDRVPPSALGIVCNDDLEDQQPFGVWLCYGFGRFGTMLAPGAARMLVSKMFRGSAGQDDDDMFSLPAYIKPEAAGKGKGKAQGMSEFV